MKVSRRRAALCLGFVLGIGSIGSMGTAIAGVDMSVGIRYVINPGTVDQCSAKAKSALNAYLQNATEKTPGSGQWQAYGPPNKSGQTTAAAIVRCSTVGQGYVVTFTCAVESPGNAFGADDLCHDIAHNFSGKAVQTLATPTPVPSGCALTNLVGTWGSDNDSKVVLKMDTDGNLTDQDGVSGNWYLVGTTVTLTYYGTKTLKLSADGKHISGSGAGYTRKC
ncbi:MAG: hypothetical protein JO302_04640 [Candidatus Eremiobacteraeota bacterium]|nr:hypothetical protein [Candidatus Eremiobacteraeota bacterium]